MGYHIYTHIAVSKCSEEEKNRLVEWISKNKEELAYPIFRWCKWYNLEDDCKKLTTQFPTLIFAFIYIGEDDDDNRYVLAHNGKCMGHFKINYKPIDDIINKIDYKEDQEEDNYKIITILTDLRLQLIKKQVELLHMEDISSYFT